LTPPQPPAKLVFGVFAALAEFERELIREGTIAGLALACARGRTGGRPYKTTPAKLRLAMASMGEPETRVEVTLEIRLSMPHDDFVSYGKHRRRGQPPAGPQPHTKEALPDDPGRASCLCLRRNVWET
jgi:hypothetical protein